MSEFSHLPFADVARGKSILSAMDLDEVQYAIEESMGFCIACGEESTECVEPDARRYQCDTCGERAVYGAEELLMMGVFQ